MALRYWVGGTGNWDSTTTANWSATSGGPSGASVPTAADDVFIDNRNAPNWAASTAYTLGQIRSPLATGNGFFYEVTTAGTSAATEPTWPTVAGNTVADGTVTWTCRIATVTKTTSTSCLTLNFTNFAGTWSIDNGITLTVAGTGATITIGSGMTYDQGTTGVLSTIGSNNTVTINFNGVTIPRLTCGHTTSAATQTVTANGTTPTISNLRISPVFSNSIVSITNQVTITNSLIFTTGTLAGTAFTINGSVTFDGVGAATPVLTSGFTIPSGSTVVLNDVLIINAGTYTFNTGSNLIHNNNSLWNFGAVTLNTSPVTWHSITLGGTVTLTSDLNVLTNVTGASAITSSVTRNINVQGGWFINTSNSPVTCTNIVINFNGTGTIYTRDSQAIINSSPFTNCTININTTNPSGYVFGTTVGGASYNYFSLNNSTLNLVGNSSTVTMFDSSTRVLLFGNCTLSTNLTGSGGNQIIYSIVDLRTGTTTLNSDTTVSTDLISFDTATATINGSRFLLTGNCTSPSGRTYSGTSTIEFIGSNNQNWSTGTFQNNITINKSGGTLTLLGFFTWGAAGRTLQRTAGNINAGTSTVTIPNAAVTINNMVFNNLTITSGATITQNTLNTINNTLLLSGSATFAGTAGWNSFNFTHGGTGTIVTLQEGITYNVSGLFTMIGTAASRARIQSSLVASVTVTIASLSNQMSVSSGSIPNPATGFVLGSVAFSTQLPAALINLLPDRPTIASGSASPYTLVNPIGVTGLTNFAGQVGKKAFFNVTGTTPMNVLYAETRDIDSSGGITIYAQQSFADSTSTPNLFRTINWVTLVAPSGSAYYTFVC